MRKMEWKVGVGLGWDMYTHVRCTHAFGAHTLLSEFTYHSGKHGKVDHNVSPLGLNVRQHVEAHVGQDLGLLLEARREVGRLKTDEISAVDARGQGTEAVPEIAACDSEVSMLRSEENRIRAVFLAGRLEPGV